MREPLGRIRTAQAIACPTCRSILSENAQSLALQGRAVRCAKCRSEIRLSEETRAQLRRSRASDD